jgi:hypothetical protein
MKVAVVKPKIREAKMDDAAPQLEVAGKPLAARTEDLRLARTQAKRNSGCRGGDYE